MKNLQTILEEKVILDSTEIAHLTLDEKKVAFAAGLVKRNMRAPLTAKKRRMSGHY